jgi:hypothetical protein
MTRHSNPWEKLTQGWVHLGLPGYREPDDYCTYAGFPLNELPPIPIDLDDACDWLVEHGEEQTRGLDRSEGQLPPETVIDLAARKELILPRSFSRFMSQPQLQARVRSCTDCYLDPGERIPETVGSIPGQLIHFLSDSQSCAHWYLHILPTDESAVLESIDLYCYTKENSQWMENPSCRLEKIDLVDLGFTYCAPSFSDFLYRFWIENEIWFALYDKTRRPLKPLELDYVAHYQSRKR